MNEQTLMAKVQRLNSEPLQQELSAYLDYLLSKQTQQTSPTPQRVPRFGGARGVFKMAEDFDAPLDDFNDYMS